MTVPVELGHNSGVDSMGGKATGIDWLISEGFNTPRAWALPPGPVDGLESIIAGDTAYAVRSSANVEDGATASFAGQFLTVLDVAGVDSVRRAIEDVRASASGLAPRSYADAVASQTVISMSVVIQEMVEPVVSGVAFSRNPITGLNEVVIEAVAGRGDQLVSDGVTPHRWVRRWGEWTTAPAESPLSDDVALRVADEAATIAAAFGTPADLEWVWDGEQVRWLQVRPITGVGEIGVYSNRISKEVMPGLIKPLVWSVNVPVVNRAWIELFTEAIGTNDLRPEDLARPFAYRSYFNMSTIGDIFEHMGMARDSLESLIGLPPGPEQPKFKPSARTMLKTPRLVAFALGRARYGKRVGARLPDFEAAFAAFDVELGSMTEAELLAAVDGLMDVTSDAAYANIVVPLLANLYTALLRRRLSNGGFDLEQIDLGGDGRGDVDPNPHLERLAKVVADHGPESPQAQGELAAFLDRFGHFSDSGNDFSVAPWREQPDLVLAMAAAQQPGPKRVLQPWPRLPLTRLQRMALDPLRKRAAAFQLKREQVSSLYTYGYGLFRKYFLELGRRLSERGVLAESDHIMYLSLDQVRAAIDGDLSAERARDAVEQHRSELERVADIALPEVIYGDDFIPASASVEGTLRGVATSRGHYRGPVRVVNGAADFPKVQDGDVLVIPYSDVGWTPLFAKAGAVVAESGGLLSHSSIVAREYGIPCVVSVDGATRLDDGVTVVVDGYQGNVVVD